MPGCTVVGPCRGLAATGLGMSTLYTRSTRNIMHKPSHPTEGRRLSVHVRVRDARMYCSWSLPGTGSDRSCLGMSPLYTRSTSSQQISTGTMQCPTEDRRLSLPAIDMSGNMSLVHEIYQQPAARDELLTRWSVISSIIAHQR